MEILSTLVVIIVMLTVIYNKVINGVPFNSPADTDASDYQ